MNFGIEGGACPTTPRLRRISGKFHSSLRTARGTYPPPFAGKREEERVLASIAIHSSGSVREDATVEIFVEGLHDLIPQAPILMLESGLPLELEVVPRVEDYLVEGRCFGGASPVVLELLLCLLPRVAPEHTGELGDLEIKLLVRQGTGVEPERQLRMLGTRYPRTTRWYVVFRSCGESPAASMRCLISSIVMASGDCEPAM